MATWKSENSMLTEVGIRLLNKLKLGDGDSITLTRIVAGSGRVPESQIHSQTKISGTVKNMTLYSRKEIEGGSEISFFLNNEGFTGEYTVQQIGIFVTHPDYAEEQLYFISQCDEGSADVVPAFSDTPMKLDYSIFLEHNNSSDITLTIDPLGTVKIEDFDELKQSNTEQHTALSERISANTQNISTLTEKVNTQGTAISALTSKVDNHLTSFSNFKAGLKSGKIVTVDSSGNLIASGKAIISGVNSVTVTDAIEHRALSLSVAGNSSQASTPTPTAPVYPVNSNVVDVKAGTKTITFPSSIVLRSIGDYKDTIEWDGSKWWKVQRIAEVNVDGTEVSIGRPSFSNGSSYARASIYTPDGTGFKAFNDALPSSPVITSHGNATTHPSNSAKFYGYLEASSGVYRVHLHILYSAVGLTDGAKDATTRTNEVISWFKAQNTAGTPVKVMYVLANPVVTEIPITDVLELYATSTQVSCSITGSSVNLTLGYALNTTDDTIMYILKSLARKSDVQTANTFAEATLLE